MFWVLAILIGVLACSCFNLQLLDETGCLASFPILIFHLNICFGQVSVQIFLPVFKLICLFSC